jgi:hypothetical protein
VQRDPDNARMKLPLGLVAAAVLLVACGDGNAETNAVAPGFCEPPQISGVTLSDLKGTEKISCNTASAAATSAINCELQIGQCNTEGAIADAAFVLGGESWDCSFEYDNLEPPPGQIPRLQAIECWRIDRRVIHPVVRNHVERVGPPGRVSFNVDDYQIPLLGQ